MSRSRHLSHSSHFLPAAAPPAAAAAYRPSFPLVPYKPNAILRRLRSCPAAFDDSKYLQLLYEERFKESKVRSPRSTLCLDDEPSPEDLLSLIREHGNCWKHGNKTLSMAETAGNCQGINQAMQSAVEVLGVTGGILHLTPEILQSVYAQAVNGQFSVVSKGPDGWDISSVEAGDIVLLPAFGSTSQEVASIRAKGADVISTLCPWMVQEAGTVNCTSIIHKFSELHADDLPLSGNYVVVRSLEDAQYLGNYILCGEDCAGFAARFQGCTSPGFDPQTMLGVISFTSHASCEQARLETGEIEDILRAAMIEKYGIDRMDDHFTSLHDNYVTAAMNTATQEPNAYKNRKFDMVLIVGAFDSKRLRRLQHIARIARIPTYWVNSPLCINTEKNCITWQDYNRRIGSTFGFIPQGESLIGFIRDPSTPDSVVQEVMDRIVRTKHQEF